jgi:hypothetical protein
MYFLITFAAQDATALNKTSIEASLQEITLQLDLLWTHCHENSTALLVHGL